MKKEWVDSALTIALLIAVVVSWFIVGWQDARIDTQDRRIAALEEHGTGQVTFHDVVIRTKELDNLILARLDSLEGEVWEIKAYQTHFRSMDRDIMNYLERLDTKVDDITAKGGAR